jgi:hypothetical protein
VATQEEFDEFLRLCDEDGADCAFSAPEGAPARWEALATALRAEPLELPDGTLYTYDLLITGAEASARLLRNSRLLSYAGWGHTAYGRSDCITQHVNAYLLAGSLPPAGTVCPANPNPFVPSALRATSPAPLVGLPPSWFFLP